MNSREIILYLAYKYEGRWNDIYDAIAKRQQPDNEEAMEICRKNQCKYITIIDEEYPTLLKNIHKPPFILFYEGDISLLRDEKTKLSVVGSRECSKYGERITNKFIESLAKELVIVSGMARGIDSIAHNAAIKVGGRTIGVLGNGLNAYYLKENEELFEEMKRNQLVITEYPPDTKPSPENFPIRNRILAGLSRCLLITEGKKQSGTRITVEQMLCNDGEICCVPSNVGGDSLSNYLIKNYANLVETPEDVLEVMRYKKTEPIFKN